MSVSAIDAVSNPHATSHPDPRAQNALKQGLFTAHDFIREGEQAEYARIAAALRDDIAPESAVEQLFTSEIIGATWRLRRCGLVEASLITESGLDPMADETTGSDAASKTGKIQKSVDRARAQSHNIIRRSIAELRKLQTQKTIRAELNLGGRGLEDIPAVLRAAARFGSQPAPAPNPTPDSLDLLNTDPEDLDLDDPATFNALDQFLMTSPLASPAFKELLKVQTSAPTPIPAPAAPQTHANLFCKSTTGHMPTPPRNGPCPCGSGIKFKKCCNNTTTLRQKLAA